MEPQTTEFIRVDIKIGQLFSDLLGDRWANLFKDLASLLNEKFVDTTDARRIGTIEKAKVISDVVREQCL